MGQIKSVGETFYGLDIDIEVLKEEFVGNMVHVTLQLRFDNSAFLTEKVSSQDVLDEMKIESDLFFEAFPFHIVFTEDMIVKSAGNGLANVMPDIEGHDISHIFILRRPMVEFGWEQVLSHTNNVFELESVDNIQKKEDPACENASEDDFSQRLNFDSPSEVSDVNLPDGMKLHLKGQMIWTPEWQAILFLGTPVLPHLTAMFDTGLFINDLSLHDNSRDLVLAGTQTSAELKLALDQEQVKSKKLEDNMKKLDEEMRRTDELLYQMIPRQIADRLRAGEPALDTCQVFDHVTILFSDVVGFTMICSRISPLQVVNMLNSMYSKFDHLCALHETYKVETIGDAYVVVSGAPEEVDDHAERIADMALGMIDTMQALVDPSTGNHLQIRVGVNSGVVVAGVVGLKMPRYCLFGDTVNTAAKMESSSEHMKIQMTHATMSFLQDNTNYLVTERGFVDIKDKGKMFTYWLAASESYQSRVTNIERKLLSDAKATDKRKSIARATDSPSTTPTPPISVPSTTYQDTESGHAAALTNDPAGVHSSSVKDLREPVAHHDVLKFRKSSSPIPVLIFNANSKPPSRTDSSKGETSSAGHVAPMFKSVRSTPRPERVSEDNGEKKRTVGSPDQSAQPSVKKRESMSESSSNTDDQFIRQPKPGNNFDTTFHNGRNSDKQSERNLEKNRSPAYPAAPSRRGSSFSREPDQRVKKHGADVMADKTLQTHLQRYLRRQSSQFGTPPDISVDQLSDSQTDRRSSRHSDNLSGSRSDIIPVQQFSDSQTDRRSSRHSDNLSGSHSDIPLERHRSKSRHRTTPAATSAAPTGKRELSSPNESPAHRPPEPFKQPSPRMRLGITPSSSSSFEYEGSNAGAADSDSDTFSRPGSTFQSPTKTDQQRESAPSVEKAPIFTIRPEDYINTPAKPEFVEVATRPVKSELDTDDELGLDLKSQAAFAKILAAKGGAVLPGSRRMSQDSVVLTRRLSHDAACSKQVTPAISITSVTSGESSDPTNHRILPRQSSINDHDGTAEQLLSSMTNASKLAKNGKSVPNVTRVPVQNLAARERLAKKALPRKEAEVQIRATPTPTPSPTLMETESQQERNTPAARIAASGLNSRSTTASAASAVRMPLTNTPHIESVDSLPSATDNKRRSTDDTEMAEREKSSMQGLGEEAWLAMAIAKARSPPEEVVGKGAKGPLKSIVKKDSSRNNKKQELSGDGKKSHANGSKTLLNGSSKAGAMTHGSPVPHRGISQSCVCTIV
ncbi:Soluble guanylate cyclase 88E [Hypsibius exemplaris]|uniref:guanylate cyclase n=1 Tax=Hypsibius exemplaris TaxID=2072580 RepID=A0A1W0WA16_HYPEX|nr:Soluble guanylate cyclase 88E [Hypsibius exemplaris]